MKVLLEVPDHKASSLMEVLNSISYVKTKTMDTEKEAAIKNIQAGLKEVTLFQKGKLKTTKAKDFLNDL